MLHYHPAIGAIPPTDQNAKNAYDKNQAQCGQQPSVPLQPSAQTEAESRYHAASKEAAKSYKAAEFLAKHPEFNEFVDLIRSGGIRI